MRFISDERLTAARELTHAVLARRAALALELGGRVLGDDEVRRGLGVVVRHRRIGCGEERLVGVVVQLADVAVDLEFCKVEEVQGRGLVTGELRAAVIAVLADVAVELAEREGPGMEPDGVERKPRLRDLASNKRGVVPLARLLELVGVLGDASGQTLGVRSQALVHAVDLGLAAADTAEDFDCQWNGLLEEAGLHLGC